MTINHPGKYSDFKRVFYIKPNKIMHNFNEVINISEQPELLNPVLAKASSTRTLFLHFGLKSDQWVLSAHL
jgi:hypothetical protein